MTITKLYLIGHGQEKGQVEFDGKNKILCSGIHSYSIEQDKLSIILGGQLGRIKEGIYHANGKDVLDLSDKLELNYIQLQRNVEAVIPGSVIYSKELSIVQYGSGQSTAILQSWKPQQNVTLIQYNDSTFYGGKMTVDTLYVEQKAKGCIRDVHVKQRATFSRDDQSILELTKDSEAEIIDGKTNKVFDKVFSEDACIVVNVV